MRMLLNLVFSALCALLMIQDLRTSRMDNALILLIALLSVPYILVTRASLLYSPLCALCALPLLIFWRSGGLGGADVKFTAAACLYLGPARLLPFFLFMVPLSVLFLIIAAVRKKKVMPYGPVLAGAACIACFF